MGSRGRRLITEATEPQDTKDRGSGNEGGRLYGDRRNCARDGKVWELFFFFRGRRSGRNRESGCRCTTWVLLVHPLGLSFFFTRIFPSTTPTPLHRKGLRGPRDCVNYLDGRVESPSRPRTQGRPSKLCTINLTLTIVVIDCKKLRMDTRQMSKVNNNFLHNFRG